MIAEPCGQTLLYTSDCVGLATGGSGDVLAGVIAGLAGTAELLSGPGIRRRPESWTHAVAAMMLLSVIGANWGLRLFDPQAAILPWGMMLSLGGLVFVGLAGWQGGKLVFEHQMGVMIAEEKDEPEAEDRPDLPGVARDPAR